MNAKLTHILRRTYGFLLALGADKFCVLEKNLSIIHKIIDKQWKHYIHDDNKGLIEVYPVYY